jgi:general secretion pathway protein H
VTSVKATVRSLQQGFTLLELMVVVAIIALATATVSLALPDSNRDRLETEALRLSALLESARAQSRTSGVPVYWRTTANGFEFLGLSTQKDAPNPLAGTRNWLQADTRARVVVPTDTANLVLGPEPLITAQRLQLQLGTQSLTLATDGLGPFTVSPGAGNTP